MWLSTLEIGAAQLRSVTDMAPKSPFLCVLGTEALSSKVFVPAQKPSCMVWRVIGTKLFGGTQIIFWVTRFIYVSNVALDRKGVCRTPNPPPGLEHWLPSRHNVEAFLQKLFIAVKKSSCIQDTYLWMQLVFFQNDSCFACRIEDSLPMDVPP